MHAANKLDSSNNDEWAWRESQPVWLLWTLVIPVLFGLVILSWKGYGDRPIPLPAAGVLCAVVFVLMLILGRMVTEVRSDRLVWSFGWLGLPRWQLRFEEIVAVELTRNRVYEGLGIHFTKTGMLYNAHGLDALCLSLRNGRQIRLGTQEGRRLLQALEPRLQRRQP